MDERDKDTIRIFALLQKMIKGGHIRLVHIHTSAPIEETFTEGEYEVKAYEPTGDIYLSMHFVRKQ